MDLICNSYRSGAFASTPGNAHISALTFSAPRANTATHHHACTLTPNTRDKLAGIRREQHLILVFVAVAHVAAVFAVTHLKVQAVQPALAPPIIISLLEAPPAPAAPEALPPTPVPLTPPPSVTAPSKPPTPPPPVPRPTRRPQPVIKHQPIPAKPATPALVAPAVEAEPQPIQHAPSLPKATKPARTAAAPTMASQPPKIIAARFDAAYLNNPPPTYPALARRLGEQGTVLLRVHVTSDGTPASIELKTSSGSRRLDRSAEQAVSRWRFVPASQGGENVPAWVIVPVVFKLEGL